MENLKIIADNIIIPACKIGEGILPNNKFFDVDLFAHHHEADFYTKNKKKLKTKDIPVTIFEQTNLTNFKLLFENNKDIFLETEEQVKKFVFNYRYLLADKFFETCFFLKNSDEYPYIIQITKEEDKTPLKFNSLEYLTYEALFSPEGKIRFIIPKII